MGEWIEKAAIVISAVYTVGLTSAQGEWIEISSLDPKYGTAMSRPHTGRVN